MQGIAQDLQETQILCAAMAQQLDAMGKLGALHAAQFMAVTRLLDAEETIGDKSSQASDPT